MRKDDIRLSEKYGLNPTIPHCFYCGKEKNELILMGHLPNDEEAPKGKVFDHEPCDKCRELMRQRIILISVRDGEEGDNPYRTGGWVVITEEGVKKLTKPGKFQDSVLKSRMAFVPDSVWNFVGLPRGETK